MANLIGQFLGRYRILEQLGEGGMATVYKAYDTRLERNVAIKVIRRNALPQEQLERIRQRFEREAKALAKLSHPNIVKVIDYGEHDGAPYLVLEYLPGGTLKARMKSSPVPWQEAVRLLIPIANALDYAHEQNIIHRDVKPANILLTVKGQPMLSDFGIAKILEMEDGHTLTGTGVGLGTPEYMSPEQGLGQGVDARADIYSLGIVLYEMLTGRKPFRADTPMAVIIKHINDPLPSPSQYVPDLPITVESMVLKALEKKPENRYQSMGEFVSVISGLIAGGTFKQNQTLSESTGTVTEALDPRHTRLSASMIGWYAMGALATVALVGFIGWMATPPPPPATEVPVGETPISATEAPVDIDSTMIGKDGATLIYVPEGEFPMGSDSGDLDEQPIHQVYLDAFLIDQTEVTNEMYKKCVDAGQCDPPSDAEHFSNFSYAKHPVVYVNWNQANDYCSWAERRLPTESEWEKAARGTDGRTYPWGENIDSTFANYNNNVDDTSPVGSYESGKSPYGVYDMAGNVREWVQDWYGENYYQKSPALNPFGLDAGQYRVLRGGSWLSDNNLMRSVDRYLDIPTYALIDLGFRCAISSVDTEPPATKDPAVSIVITDAASTVVAELPLTAASFRPTLVEPATEAPLATEAPIATEAPTFDIGSTMIGEDGATLAYVPAGEFTMGSEAYPEEMPIHTVYLEAFWIDQTEVTNGMYIKCVITGICQEPLASTSRTHSNYYGNSEFDNYPVAAVKWNMAKAYCEWAGRRLPTEAEWEKAARGIDGRIYPWGNDLPNNNLLNYNSNVGDTTEIRKYPDGKSIYGAYDMAGNVWEWVNDWYAEAYYQNSPFSNPPGPDSGSERVMRGGSWEGLDISVRSVSRGYFNPEKSTSKYGFRCARSVP